MDVKTVAKAIGKTKAFKTRAIANELLTNIAHKLRLQPHEVLTGGVEDWVNGFWVLHIKLWTLEPTEKLRRDFTLKPLHDFATVFIHVYTRKRWALGVGECGATIESITKDIHRAFRIQKRSVKDMEFM